MKRNEGTRPGDTRSNTAWGSGKIVGGVAVIAAAVALIAPGTAGAYSSPSTTRSYSMLPAPIAPVLAPTTTDDTSASTVSWGDVSWGDVV
jgi:hypothetical protein